MSRLCFRASLSLFSAALFSIPLSAATISYTGAFLEDDQAHAFSFTVAAPGTAVFRTLGYAGGVNGEGTTIVAGGFDPILSLFDSTGDLIGLNGDDPGAVIDPLTGNGFDSLISTFLTVGDYTLILTENDNLPIGPSLSDGFTRTGQGNFTGPQFAGVSGAFWDATPSQRNGNWAVDLEGITASAVPEPGTLLTLGTGFFGILLGASRFRRHSQARISAAQNCGE
jgi:hypothetical protein